MRRPLNVILRGMGETLVGEGMTSGRHPVRRTTDWLTVAAFGLVAGIYLWLAFGYLPTGTYWSPDNGLKRIQADNLRFTPWPDLSIEYPGQWLDPDFKFAPFAPLFYFVSAGRLHFFQSPAIALLGRPFIWLMGDQGERVVPVLAGLCSVLLVAGLMRRLALRPAWAGVLSAGLGTPLLFYSLLFWEHTLAVALGLGVVAVLLRQTGPLPLRDGLLAGTLLGLAASIRKDLLLFAFVLGLVFVWEALEGVMAARRDSHASTDGFPEGWRPGLGPGWLGLGGAFAVVFSLYGVSHPRAQNILPPEAALAADFAPQAYFVTHGWGSLPDFIFSPGYGIVGGLLVIALGVYWLAHHLTHSRLRETLQVGALTVIGLGIASFIPQHLRSGVSHGFLSASPFLVLSLNSTSRGAPRVRVLSHLALGFLVLYMLGVGLLVPRGPLRGGLEWGARYMLIVFPLCTPLAVDGLRAIRERAAHLPLARLHLLAALTLFGLSIFIQVLGIGLIRDSVRLREGSQAALLGLPEKIIVADMGWIASGAPELYAAKELFLLNSRSDLPRWAAQAHAARVRRFAFVSHGPLDEAAAHASAPAGARLSLLETRRLENDFFVTRLEFLPAPE